MSTPVLVVIKNNVVHQMTRARNAEELEALFSHEIREHGIEPYDTLYDDGYIELEDGTSICMSWAQDPEIDTTEAKAMGFEVNPDPDQDGYFYFVDPHGNRSDISYESEISAWIQILSELGSYREVDKVNDPNKNVDRYIQVEYDLSYTGGDYNGVGQFALIPVALINTMQGDVKEAFREHTKLDPSHIVHYTSDEVFDANGDLIE